MLTRSAFAIGCLVAGQGFLIVIDAPTALAGDCDIAIINGRVMDPETNFDAVRNVCVKDRKIAGITEAKISGKEIIDASGYVVAPGFIDTHHHGAGNLWGVKASLRDGVTTPLDLELGVIHVDAYYAEREGKWRVNYGAGFSHELHRMRVLDNMDISKPAHGDDFGRLRNESYKENDMPDWAVTQASLDQLNEMRTHAERLMRSGVKSWEIGGTRGRLSPHHARGQIAHDPECAADHQDHQDTREAKCQQVLTRGMAQIDMQEVAQMHQHRNNRRQQNRKNKPGSR